MSLDLAATLRRLKPQKVRGPLARRSDDALPFVAEPVGAGPVLLLDTTVYIDTLQGRLPDEVGKLLTLRQLDHSSVALAELAHAFGRLDPAHPGTAGALRAIEAVIAAVPVHRLAAPSVQATVEAGIIAGTVARLRGLAKTDRQPLFNDAALFLQALEGGSTLLTRNIADLDLL